MSTYRNINVLYEFRTPNGYLGMGYNNNQLSHIFQYLSKNRLRLNEYKNIIRFCTNQNLKYEKLIDTEDFAFFLNSFTYSVNKSTNPLQIRQRLWGDITDNDLDDINFFNISSTENEEITDLVKNNDLENLFLPATIEFIQTFTNVKVLFTDTREGGFVYDDSFFDSFRKFCQKFDPNQIVFITNTLNINDIYNDYLDRHGIHESFMKTVGFPFYITPDGGHNIHINNDNKGDIEYDKMVYQLVNETEIDIKRPKRYLCLNRNSTRRHRIDLILSLKQNNIFDDGVISFHHSNTFDRFCETEGNEIYKNLIKNDYPYTIDEEDAHKVAGMLPYLTKKNMWLDTYFSIISETSVECDYIFITEKTTKALIYYHPFIIWGNPYTLKYLRTLGFKTFPEFFDEKYDEIIDKDARLNLIIKNVKKLCSLSTDELHFMYQKVKPKLIHNRNLLREMYTSDMLYKKIHSLFYDE